MDSESTRLIQDLRAALLKAMSESRDMRQALDRLRQVGWSAYIVIDEQPAESDQAAETDAIPGPALDGEPQMDGADHLLLRSLGIDPNPEPRGV